MGPKKQVRAYVKQTGKAVPAHLRSQPAPTRKKEPKIMFDRTPPSNDDQGERPGQGWIVTSSKEKLWIGPKVNLSGKNLADLSLRDANLQEANLERAWLKNADLRGANLRGASLGYAKLDGAKLGNTDLRDVNWRGVHLKELTEALIDEDDIFSLYSTKYDKHNFTETARSWNLSDANFEALVMAGRIEVRDNGSHIVVLEHFNPWEHHVPAWQYQNPPMVNRT